MSDQTHHQTAEADRISLGQKVIYGFGAMINNLLAAAIGGMAIVLNLGLGMNPALVGLLGALPRLTDAFTDPLMGYISDNTKSRWGRRRPYIFCGAIAAGILFALLWQLPSGQSESFYFWFFLLMSMLFYLAYTVFATPWVALGYELTPDYHERTRLMAVQNFMGQLTYLVSPWFLWFMQRESLFVDMVDGAAWLAIIIGVVTIATGVMPALFLRERFTHPLNTHTSETNDGSSGLKANILEFFCGFMITIRFKPFLYLCGATFLVFNGFMLVSSFQFYVIIYYVFGGDTKLGAEYAGYAGTISAVSTFCVIFFVSWLSTKIGKRKAFFVAIWISVIGYLSKWFFLSPDNPWLMMLSMPLMAFGLGGLFTLMGSMIADVCDMDELTTGERREGMFGSIYWWVVKLGMAVALAAGGVLLNLTGFDVSLEGNQSESTLRMMRIFDAVIPAFASIVAIWMVRAFPITEQKAYEVRQELEKRRGEV